MAHPKGLLIERAQKLGLERPEFDTAKTGPEHEPAFITDVVLDGQVIGTGQGKSKREAEKQAAEEALAALDNGAESSGGGRRGAAGSGRGAAKPTRGRSAADDGDDGNDDETHEYDGPFTGPWPMFDDLLASVVDVAERRVSADLRGDAALTAIRDFSLTLYKDLLSDLGELVDEDDDDDEDED